MPSLVSSLAFFILILLIPSVFSKKLDHLTITSTSRINLDAPPIEIPGGRPESIAEQSNIQRICDEPKLLHLAIVVEREMCNKQARELKNLKKNHEESLKQINDKVENEVRNMIKKANEKLQDACFEVHLANLVTYCDSKMQDPYAELKNHQSELVLLEFRNKFPVEQKDHGNYGAAILITGFEDGTVFSGRAYRGGACSKFKYGWIEKIHGGLFAHEIAHLVGAQHDTQGLMTEAVNVGVDNVAPLSSFSIGEIANFLSTVDAGCIKAGGGDKHSIPPSPSPSTNKVIPTPNPSQSPKGWNTAPSKPTVTPSFDPPTPEKAPTFSPTLTPTPTMTASNLQPLSFSPTPTSSTSQTPSVQTHVPSPNETDLPSETPTGTTPTPSPEDGFVRTPPPAGNIGLANPGGFHKFEGSSVCDVKRFECSDNVKTHLMAGGPESNSIVKVTIRQLNGYFNLRLTAFEGVIVGFAAQIDFDENALTPGNVPLVQLQEESSRLESWINIKKIRKKPHSTSCCDQKMHTFVIVKMKTLGPGPQWLEFHDTFSWEPLCRGSSDPPCAIALGWRPLPMSVEHECPHCVPDSSQ